MIRLFAVVVLCSVMGCSTTPPAEEPTPEQQFLSMIGEVSLSDEEAVTMAEDMCFEVDLHVETARDFRLFLRTFVARVGEQVGTEQAMPFVVAAMKVYCPEVEQFRPSTLMAPTVGRA